MKNILLTCLAGTNLCYEFVADFQKRQDVQLFVSDMNAQAKGRILTDNFIPLLSAHDPDYCQDLLKKAQAHGIDMIIPGSDEEALAIMGNKDVFETNDIVVAVQDQNRTAIFQSKTAMYDHLKAKGFPVPFYRTFRTEEDLRLLLEDIDYPNHPYLIKPNQARGGKGIMLLTERIIPNKDNLALCDKSLLSSLLDGKTEYILMEYIDGVVYDVDVLKYKSGEVFFGARKRFTNVTKLFSGNIFDGDERILAFCRRLYDTVPTAFLLDYDLMVTKDGRIELLEINPRPSGSTISYLPFDINLYYILAKSYLDNEEIKVPESLIGKSAHTFYKMMEGVSS